MVHWCLKVSFVNINRVWYSMLDDVELKFRGRIMHSVSTGFAYLSKSGNGSSTVLEVNLSNLTRRLYKVAAAVILGI